MRLEWITKATFVFVGVSFLVLTSFSQSSASSSGSTRTGGALAATGGDVSNDLDGSFLQPYKNAWKVTVVLPTGASREMGTWTDQLEKTKSGEQELLKRTQISKLANSSSLTVNVFDPKKMSPVSSDLRDLLGTDFMHRNFSGNSVRSVSMSGPDAVEVASNETKFDVPVVDFYGGMYGLLLASLPLREGYRGRLPSVAEFEDKLQWVDFNVVGQEEINAGMQKINTWHVEAETAQGPMKFWLTKQPPYIIQLKFTGAKGNTWTWSMQ